MGCYCILKALQLLADAYSLRHRDNRMNAHCRPRITRGDIYCLSRRHIASRSCSDASLLQTYQGARTSFRGECRGEIDTELVTHLKQTRRDVRARTSSFVVAAAYPPPLSTLFATRVRSILYICRSRGSQLQFSANIVRTS